ncbi:AraC family transcriptional regulator [Actinomycetospora endophytica]|uniref:AraC family transcriptional regulator n=1 Tax=Actinomycetospora endophytica TaxID=2291215 RepID=A0ABS8P7B7_9PSEU|nr:AraC family transcriptional regulator [Actinomycetospora endophytica]MCD2194160.1 AraC family transcriptional regulator [Actinomycetospora endophytica]
MRHEPDVRSYAVTHPAGTIVPPQPPGWHQVLLAASGAMTVEVPEGTWFVPPGAAVVVRQGEPHRIRTTSSTRLRNLYLRGSDLGPTRVVAVAGLLRELLLTAVARAPLHRDRPHDAALAALVELELAAAGPVEPLRLPMPRDPAARRVAERILTDPGEAGGVDLLCRGSGAARRTVERRFAEETGLGVARWRRRARLAAALEALARGDPPSRVATEIGYATASAFGAMVKAELGYSPMAAVR